MIDWMKRLSQRISLGRAARSSIGLLTVIGILTYTVYEVTKIEVTIQTEEEVLSVSTHASTVDELLEELDIKTGVHDEIEPSQETELHEGQSIVHKRAQQVVFTHNGETANKWTVAKTIGEFLEEQGIRVKKHDKIKPSLHHELLEFASVEYEAAFPIHLVVDGTTKKVWTTSTTVADFLKKEIIELDDLDRVEPRGEEYILAEGEVRIVRVQKVTDVVEETIDFTTARKHDSTLKKGVEKEERSGKKGKLEKHYELVLEDGEEVSRKLVKEVETEKSVERVIAIGTMEPPPVAHHGNSSAKKAEPEKTHSSWQTFSATAYTASCKGCSGVTATGINLKENPDRKVIAVDPSVIPLGTKVEIKGYGTYTAADTGGAIKGKKIDLFIPTRDKALEFGRRNIELRILD